MLLAVCRAGAWEKGSSRRPDWSAGFPGRMARTENRWPAGNGAAMFNAQRPGVKALLRRVVTRPKYGSFRSFGSQVLLDIRLAAC